MVFCSEEKDEKVSDCNTDRMAEKDTINFWGMFCHRQSF